VKLESNVIGRAIAGVMACAALILLVGEPAVASPGRASTSDSPFVRATEGHGVALGRMRPVRKIGPVQRGYQKVDSYNWSGYAQHTTTKGTFTAVEGTWTVPKVDTSKPGAQYAADWVGIGGYSDDTLVQAGTLEWNAHGTAKYDAWTEILPAALVPISGLTVHPGDKIETTVVEKSKNMWAMTVDDVTTGKSGGRTVKYKASGESAEAIHERPEVGSGLATLATTSNVTFEPDDFSTAAPGSPVWKPLLESISAAKLAEIFMVNNSGSAVIASPSAPSSNDEGFTVADGSKAPPPPTIG
jgi:Peptidase A4 family